MAQAIQDEDAATVIRLAHHQLPHMSREALARITGLSTGTIHRLLLGAPLMRLDRNRQALMGLGAPEHLHHDTASPLTSHADQVQHLLDRPERVDAATIEVVTRMLATQRRLDDLIGAEAVLPSARSHAAAMAAAADRARGPHSAALRTVAAEWVQFEGWLLASAGQLDQAVTVLERAAALAKEVNQGPLVAQARNFLGYIARRRGDAPTLLAWFSAAWHTPGAHPAQRVGDAIQAAHGHALLGEYEQAQRTLDSGMRIAEVAAALPPPPTAYWLTPTFHHLNLGLAHIGLGNTDVARDLLTTGLDHLPAEQQGADWTHEYRHALTTIDH
ncbi:hypothetical protein [Nocardiopsis nanhaiensis]